MGLVGNTDHLAEVHGAELQQAMAGWASASTAAPLLSGPVQAPEVQVVFLYDQLSTEDVRALGSTSFPKLHKLMIDSPSSLSIPFTTRAAPLTFEGVTSVPLAAAETYLAENPSLATNGKSDMLLVQVPTSVQAGERDYPAQDAAIGRVAAAVAKATNGNYAALLTGANGNAKDIEYVTMRRRLSSSDVQVRSPPPALRSPLPAVLDLFAASTPPPPSVFGSEGPWLNAPPPGPCHWQYGLHITPELYAGLAVSFLLIIIFLCGFCCLFSLQARVAPSPSRPHHPPRRVQGPLSHALTFSPTACVLPPRVYAARRPRRRRRSSTRSRRRDLRRQARNARGVDWAWRVRRGAWRVRRGAWEFCASIRARRSGGFAKAARLLDDVRCMVFFRYLCALRALPLVRDGVRMCERKCQGSVLAIFILEQSTV